MKVLKWLLLVALFLLGSLPVLAQGDWTYSFTPSVWAGGLNGDVQIGPITDELRVNFNETYGGAELGASFELEGSNGHMGVYAEVLGLNVADGAEPPDIYHETADVSVDQKFLMLAGLYRLRPSQPSIDFILGARFIDVSADLAVTNDMTGVRGASAQDDWLDGVFGARVRYDIGDRWSALGHLDFGSGGSRLSYQVILSGSYRFTRSASGTFGYRTIATDRDTEALHYESMKVSGPYVGLTFDW